MLRFSGPFKNYNLSWNHHTSIVPSIDVRLLKECKRWCPSKVQAWGICRLQAACSGNLGESPWRRARPHSLYGKGASIRGRISTVLGPSCGMLKDEKNTDSRPWLTAMPYSTFTLFVKAKFNLANSYTFEGILRLVRLTFSSFIPFLLGIN